MDIILKALPFEFAIIGGAAFGALLSVVMAVIAEKNPAKVPVLKVENRVFSESQAICEWLEETVPQPPLMPRDPDQRYEVRRLCSWFDDKFQNEVTSKLLYERVNKKVAKAG